MTIDHDYKKEVDRYRKAYLEQSVEANRLQRALGAAIELWRVQSEHSEALNARIREMEGAVRLLYFDRSCSERSPHVNEYLDGLQWVKEMEP